LGANRNTSSFAKQWGRVNRIWGEKNRRDHEYYFRHRKNRRKSHFSGNRPSTLSAMKNLSPKIIRVLLQRHVFWNAKLLWPSDNDKQQEWQ